MPHLNAEIISIGDEMISGARVDTNTAWLSRRLAELGVDVHFHTTIGDTLAHNTDAFRIALRRCDLVVATGGLGPTQDDLTREAIAESVGRPLQIDPESLSIIESMFRNRGIEMPLRNEVQAMFPLGAKPILNPNGTAPGVDFVATREDGTESRIFALPGVPAEMKTMFDESVAPAILSINRTGNNDTPKHIRHCVLKFFGVGESDMEQRLGNMIARDRQPRVGITVTAATISLRISAMADTVADCEQMIAATRAEIMQRVGELYFGEGESYEQQQLIAETLKKRGQRLCLIELGHAAPLGNWFAAIGDCPAIAGGLSLAGITELRKFAGCENLTAAMPEIANLVRQRFAADWVLLVDRYPDLNAPQTGVVPAADITFGVGHPGGQWTTRSQSLGGHPSIVHPRIAKAAMMYLRSVWPIS